jgi:hemerythrin superfamily protein
MNKLSIWKEFEKKSKATQNKIYKQVINVIKQSGRRNVTKDDDIVMDEIINKRSTWIQEI